MANRAESRRSAALLFVSLVVTIAALPALARRDTGDSLTLLSGEMRGSKRVPSEAEWARQLLEGFGLDEILPEDADDGERFALLCPDLAEADEAGGIGWADGVPLRVSVAAPPDTGPGEPVRMVFQAPATALYQVSVAGIGMQRWTLDGRLVGHLDPSTLGVAQAPAIVPLREGPHELAGYLAPLARLERVELAAHRSLCIAPADGWQAGRPLRYASMARTLVHALGLEKELPPAGSSAPLEGEDFDEASAGAEVSERRLHNDPSGRAWARAAGSPAEFSYRLRLDEPGLFSVLARLPGGGVQIWSIDGRYRATLRPRGRRSAFDWNHVMTLPLPSGEHVLRVFASRGSGIDRIRLVPHAPSDADYVGVLARQGFVEGAPDAMVTDRVANENLSRSLARSDGRFLTEHASGGRRSPLVDAETRPDRSGAPSEPARPGYSEALR